MCRMSRFQIPTSYTRWKLGWNFRSTLLSNEVVSGRTLLCVAAALLGWLGEGAWGAEITRLAEPRWESVQLFERRIRPILSDRCYSCHSSRAGKADGGLRLD